MYNDKDLDFLILPPATFCIFKSDNLQYDILARWVTGTNDSSSKRLMLQALFFFIISYRLRQRELKLDGAIGHFAEPLRRLKTGNFTT